MSTNHLLIYLCRVVCFYSLPAMWSPLFNSYHQETLCPHVVVVCCCFISRSILFHKGQAIILFSWPCDQLHPLRLDQSSHQSAVCLPAFPHFSLIESEMTKEADIWRCSALLCVLFSMLHLLSGMDRVHIWMVNEYDGGDDLQVFMILVSWIRELLLFWSKSTEVNRHVCLNCVSPVELI